MAQRSETLEKPSFQQRDVYSRGRNLLGPLLCWAVVFADIGTSVYYVPGILYGSVGTLAGFFVLLTFSVFVLLTLKYAEVTHRFPQGGGVVTVASEALNAWFGAIGGMFILVDYFLTAAISCLSGIFYLSVVLPALSPFVLAITILALLLLGLLNWFGISESAKVSLVGAVLAFLSDLAILLTIFTHLSWSQFLTLLTEVFSHQHLTGLALLTGFSGSFLAFSGLESISQLSPVMKTPRKRVAGIALLLVVVTVGLTSPLLTLLSTLLLSKRVLDDPVLNTQVVSLLAGKWGGLALQTEVALSASALLVFASNTAIIGAYHVFMALSRMEFFPEFVLARNRLRGTPHYSILLATGIPIVVLLLVRGNINILGDMYAFGLLGAFSLTCLSLDIVRRRERKLVRTGVQEDEQHSIRHLLQGITIASSEKAPLSSTEKRSRFSSNRRKRLLNFWHAFKFYIGLVTTALVILAWTTNLINKPLATFFGGTLTILGMGVAYINYSSHLRKGRVPVVVTHVEERMPGSVLAILTPENGHNEAVIRAAISHADGNPVIFLYRGKQQSGRAPQMFEFYDPYLDDRQAKIYFGKAEHLAQKSQIARRFVYRQQEPGDIARVWQIIHPRDIVVAAENTAKIEDINPDRIRYEVTMTGKVAHLLKRW